jgi:glycosyltransferase involved in cell wall biosynthesis
MSLIAPLGQLPFPLTERDGTPRLGIVVPVYNEARSIEPLYERLRSSLDSVIPMWSVLFVNDGSSDDTVARLETLHAGDDRVSYIALSRNFGHQAALCAGLDHVDGDVFVTMDGDLQHPPEMIPAMLEGWRRGYDVIHSQKTSTEDLGRVRQWTTRWAYRLIGLVANVPVIPQASDFRLLDAEARDSVAELPERARLYRGLTPWVGYRQGVLPYDAPARLDGKSRYGIRQLFGLFGRAFFDFSAAPLYVALVVGATAIALCFAYVVFVIAALIFGKSIPPGYVTQIVAISFLSSINLFLIGVLSVYVSRIYAEVRRRPSYLVGRKRIHRLEND